MRWLEEIDSGDLEAAVDLLHQDFHWYSPSNSPAPVTKNSAREFLDSFFAGFPKWIHRVDDILAVDDKVITRTIDITKHLGEFQGIPATGNDVEFSVIVIYRLKDGKIVDLWEEADVLGLMNQIGMELKPKQ